MSVTTVSNLTSKFSILPSRYTNSASVHIFRRCRQSEKRYRGKTPQRPSPSKTPAQRSLCRYVTTPVPRAEDPGGVVNISYPVLNVCRWHKVKGSTPNYRWITFRNVPLWPAATLVRRGACHRAQLAVSTLLHQTTSTAL